MSILHKNITVTGKVQGVGFRFHCKKMAQILGIKGFVKNLFDGSVYIEAEGNNTQINQFIKWCYTGPSHARVDNVSVSDSEINNFQHFDIKR